MSAPSFAQAARLPVIILTGFLGAGKTTLLDRLLRQKGASKSAIIVNEWGEAGLDHELLRSNTGTDAMLLSGGCVCCTARSDLTDTLRDLFRRRVLGMIPEFERVIIETTGMADPGPLIHALMAEPLTAARYRLGGVVTVVSAPDGEAQMDVHAEAIAQIAMADRLIVSKSDLANTDATARLIARMLRINPLAQLEVARFGEVNPMKLLSEQDWTEIPVPTKEMADGQDRHGDGIRTVTARYDAPLDAHALKTALKEIAGHIGPKLIRLKGIVRLTGESQPMAVHGVGSALYPLVPVADTAAATSRLVFILKSTEPAAVPALLDRLLPGRLLPDRLTAEDQADNAAKA